MYIILYYYNYCSRRLGDLRNNIVIEIISFAKYHKGYLQRDDEGAHTFLGSNQCTCTTDFPGQAGSPQNINLFFAPRVVQNN